MGKNVILTEDTATGLRFYKLLVSSGVFKHTTVYDTSCSGKGSGGYSHCFSAFEHLVKTKSVLRGDTLYLAIDVLYPITAEMQGNVKRRNKQIEDVCVMAKRLGIECEKLTLDCWESLVLSFEHLKAVCSSVGDIDPVAVEAYDNLRSNGVFEERCEKKFDIFSTVFSTRIEHGMTIEDCFNELLRMITTQSGEHANFAMSKTGTIGQCWRLDCVNAKNDGRCGSCYFVPPQNKIDDGRLHTGRLQHLVQHSLICKAFSGCL